MGKTAFTRANLRAGYHLGGEIHDSLTVPELRTAADSWLLDCECRMLSRATLINRRFICDKLIWFLDRENIPICDKRAIQRFFLYIANAHNNPEGRWGNPHERQPVRPRTSGNYFRWLRTFFLFLVEDGTLDESPLRQLKPAPHREDQIQPFASEHIAELLRAVKTSTNPKRDEAVLLTLLDTGARAAEICGLRWKDLDMQQRSLRVLGKGNFERTLFLQPMTLRAIMAYVRELGREPDQAIFMSTRGTRPGEALTVSGLRQIIKRLAKGTKIEGVRVSPHTFRHTFAIEFLRDGGDLRTLQAMYGHTNLEMTKRYLAIASADMRRGHAAHSPVAKLKRPR